MKGIIHLQGHAKPYLTYIGYLPTTIIILTCFDFGSLQRRQLSDVSCKKCMELHMRLPSPWNGKAVRSERERESCCLYLFRVRAVFLFSEAGSLSGGGVTSADQTMMRKESKQALCHEVTPARWTMTLPCEGSSIHESQISSVHVAYWSHCLCFLICCRTLQDTSSTKRQVEGMEPI